MLLSYNHSVLLLPGSHKMFHHLTTLGLQSDFPFLILAKRNQKNLCGCDILSHSFGKKIQSDEYFFEPIPNLHSPKEEHTPGRLFHHRKNSIDWQNQFVARMNR